MTHSPSLPTRMIRQPTVKWIKAVLTQPGRYPRLSRLAYPAIRRLAVRRGVDPLFLDRADAIRRETRSDLWAIRFLRMWMALLGTRERGSPFYDLPAQLATPQERDRAHEVLAARLERPISPRQRGLVEVNLMRLDEARFDGDTARALAARMVETSVAAYRKRGYQARDKHFRVSDAKAALLDLKARFDAAGKRFFLDRGTLLGAIREGGFIGTDYDIDLGVLASEITLDEIEALLEGSPFALIQKNPWKLAFVSALGIQIDFFLTRREGDRFISRGEGEVHQWSFDPFGLIPIDFLGAKFLVPENPEHQLAQTYGNWQTPTLFYDPSFDEPCVSYGRNINAMMYLVGRLDTALKGRDRFTAEACLSALKQDFGVDYTHLLRQPPTSGPSDP